jgi:hypothetical protein
MLLFDEDSVVEMGITMSNLWRPVASGRAARTLSFDRYSY